SRAVALSSLDRNALAHAKPADLMPDTVGKGAAAESNLREPASDSGADVAAMMQRVASQGYVRNKLTVLHGGKRPSGRGAGGARAEASARSDPGTEPALPLFAGALAYATVEAAPAIDSR